MIQKFVDRFMAKQEDLRRGFKARHPEDYNDVVKQVVQVITEDDYNEPDPDRIHEIDHGSCQGTVVYVIAETGYQPSHYWYVKVSYGSCSVCDTLQSIHNYSDEPPTDEQVNEYMALALHIVQAIKEMDDEEA